MQDYNAPPLNPLPPVVWLLALPIIAMEIVLSMGASGLVGGVNAIGWRLMAFQQLAFSPDLMREMIATSNYPLHGMWRFVSYPFIHSSPTHTAFAVVILLALGKYVGEVFRWWAVLVVFFGASIAGALAFGAVTAIKVPLFGAYPAAYGLIGAFTFMLWVRLAGTGVNQLRAFTMIGFLLFAQFLFGVLFGGGWEWVADLAGFAAGFFLSFVVSPGGWSRVMARLRER
jgi:membrane associated rhomboid family serine protease